jgi:hypothetical protein
VVDQLINPQSEIRIPQWKKAAVRFVSHRRLSYLIIRRVTLVAS